MKNRTILLGLLLWFVSACSSFNPFEGEGDYTEKRVELSGITHIENLNIFKIILIQDDEEYVLFKGGENIIEEVSVSLENECLKIDHDYRNLARNFDQIIAEIHLSNIKAITVNSPANISSEGNLSGDYMDINITNDAELVEMDLNINLSSLRFHSHGTPTGKYIFSGNCPTTNFILNGITNIQATDLKSDNVTIAQNGIGEAHVWAEKKLNVTTYNTGNIYYKGNPEIIINRIKINNQDNDAQVLPE